MKPKTQLYLVLLLTALVSLAFLGTRGLYETTEGRYGECAREMLVQNSILTPILHDRPHLTKPPLAYWSMIAGMKLLGQNGWGVRIFLAAAFFLTTLALYHIAAALWGHRTGLVAALVFATSPFPIFSASVVSTDTLLVLWEVAAFLFFIKWHTDWRRKSYWLLLMWIMLGLGFLTKGPPTLLPLLPIVIWMLLRRENPLRLACISGVIAFFVLAFGWYAIMCLQNPGLFEYLMDRELLGRLADKSRNPQWYKPFMLYLPPLIFGAGVWLYFPLVSLRRLAKLPREMPALLKQPGYGTLIALWIVIPVGILFVVKSRLTLYVLPFYPAVAVILALIIVRIRQTPFHKLLPPAIAMASIVILLKGLVALYPHELPGFPLSKDMKTLYRHCRKIDQAADEVVVFEQPHYDGLEFYYNGRLTRARITASADNAETTISSYLLRMTALPAEKMPLFICTPEDAPKLAGLLNAQKLTFTQHDAREWVIFHITHPQTLVRSPRSQTSSTCVSP